MKRKKKLLLFQVVLKLKQNNFNFHSPFKKAKEEIISQEEQKPEEVQEEKEEELKPE